LTNNDILRRLRYAFNFNDKTMMAVFELAEYPVTREQVSAWLKKDDDPDIVKMRDYQLAAFLNGLISHRRGKKEGEQPEPEKRLNNNLILRKLKISMHYTDEQMIDALELVHFKLSKHELSAFFRKKEHKHFRECKDQVLRNFIKGITAILRKNSSAEGVENQDKKDKKDKKDKTPSQPVQSAKSQTAKRPQNTSKHAPTGSDKQKSSISPADIWGKKG